MERQAVRFAICVRLELLLLLLPEPRTLIKLHLEGYALWGFKKMVSLS
jgi:hypothetical protein